MGKVITIEQLQTRKLLKELEEVCGIINKETRRINAENKKLVRKLKKLEKKLET